jgi:sugar lactone lactonase YvrE
VFVEVLSGSTYTQSVVASGLYQPNGVAVDGSGNVYIADSHNSRVLIETPTGSGTYTQSVLGSDLTYPSGVAVDGSGNVYIADSGSEKVLKETLNAGSYTQSVAFSSGLGPLRTIAVDGSGNLYVARPADEMVLKATPSGSTYAVSPVPAYGLSAPLGVTVDWRGDIFIADSGNNRVVEFAPFLGNFGPVNVASTSSAPLAVLFTFGAFDESGKLGSISAVTKGKTGLDFADAGTGTCKTGTAYAAGESCTVDVNFTPTLPGTRYGAVILHNGYGAAIATGYVQGTGVGPQLAYGLGPWTMVGPNTPGPPPSFYGISEDGAGNQFYVGDNVVVKTPAGGGAPIVINPIVNGIGFNGVGSVTVDGAGDLFIVDVFNNRLVEVPVGGAKATAIDLSAYTPSDGWPSSVAVDGAGNLFVALPDTGESLWAGCCLVELPAGGGAGIGIGIYPAKVVVDGVGDLFASVDPYYQGGEWLVSYGGVFEQQAVNGAQIFFGIPDPSALTLETIYPDATPGAFAVDEGGNLFVYDDVDGYAMVLQRSQPPPLSSYTGAPQAVQLLNIGNAPLTFPIPSTGSNPSVSPNFTLDSSASSACPLVSSGSSTPGTLAAGSSCTLTVSLTPMPSATGGGLTLTDTNLNAGPPNYATQTFQLGGGNQAPVAPSGGNFGTVNVGSTSSTPTFRTFTFAPNGALGSIAVVTQGVTGLDFTNAGEGTCRTGTTYGYGATCTVNVAFKPLFPGPRYGAVVLHGSSGNVLASTLIQGTGVGQQIAFNPGSAITLAPTFNGPVGVVVASGAAVDGAGNIFMSQPGYPPQVVEVPAGGGATIGLFPTNELELLYSDPFDTWTVAVDGTGDLFVVNPGLSNVIWRLPALFPISPTVNGVGLGCVAALAFDGADDLYISDPCNNRVVELPADGSAGIAISPTADGIALAGPSGVALDAAGDLFISDSGNGRVLEVAAVTGMVTSIAPTVNGRGIAPGLLAVDGAGNLFIADSGRVVEVQRTRPGALSFTSLEEGTTITGSPQTVDVQNAGNAPLTFPIPASGDNPSILGDFTLNSGEPSACPVLTSGSSEPLTLQPSSQCFLSISFTPPETGNFSGALTITDNTLNSSSQNYTTQVMQLSGSVVRPTPASLISPMPGFAFTGPSATFSWSTGIAVSAYQLWLGTDGIGSSNLYNGGQTTALSATMTGLPVDGVTIIYARLSSLINGVWQHIDFSYTAAAGAVLTSPTPGGVLGTTNVAFSWTAGTGVTQYQLVLGTTGVGSNNSYRSNYITAQTTTVPSIPSTGATVYARLLSSFNGTWAYNDYVYTESPGAPAVLTSPTPGTVLGTSNVTFSWTPGTGVTQYALQMGTEGVGSTNLYKSKLVTAQTVTVPSLPSNGVTVYVRLFSEINNAWVTNDYTYTEQ